MILRPEQYFTKMMATCAWRDGKIATEKPKHPRDAHIQIGN
jgi:hypothetical protein